ncbi:helix-turn-helix domain-containing protein [Streptomyces fradiae]|uniref:helix-turn-helix domain-containing protein n=1 Tax=Streptomyces fradiae TaxID=1906 RepID=UPI003516CE94
MTTGAQAPDPRSARTPADFVAHLRRLKTRSGLTYRELSTRATALGEVLPRSTVANMLSRATLPREELLAVFVRACGAGEGEAAEWEAVRRELAAGAGDAGEEETRSEPPVWPGGAEPEAGREAVPELEPGLEPEPGAGPGGRRRLGLVGVIGVAGLVLAAVSVVALVRDGTPAHGGGPPEGPVTIRAVDSGLCLGERRGDRSGQVRQLACADAGVPRYSLKRLADAHWRLVTAHPDYGPGCSGLPSGGRIPDAALEDSECGDPTRIESFTLTPHGPGYRIAPADSATPDTCITVTDTPGAEGAPLTQAPCRADARGQLFAFERAKQGPAV